MAETTLRAYLAEIEELIDQTQLDEAVAHCRQILTYYPKHLDTYRLLGKALLEQGRHGDAADVFQRVLSAVPDDFVSQVGMSIVREDEANLDAAIFHMERAFEVNPANPAIQEELKRLCGRRDGMEPPRVRLSRGALARMYARGHHFDQAVAELRAALGEDPDRPDLQLVLAEVYWLSEQRADAAETCTAILENLPHCRLANRIMADLWAASGRQHEAQVYRSRLEALDPYEAFADYGNGVGPENVPAGQVRVQKLDWSGPASIEGGESAQPSWVSSLGVTLDEPKPAGAELPDWLMETPGTPSAAPESEPDLPPAEPGTPPNWLIASAPAGLAANMMAPANEPADAADLFSDVPDWLRDQLSPSAGDPLPTQPVPTPPGAEASPVIPQAPEAGLPEWLTAPSDTQPVAPSHIPDWLQSPGPDAEASTPTSNADSVPDWMRAPEPDSSPDPSLAPPESELPEWMRPPDAQGPAAPSAPAEDTELPEWMRAPEALSAAQPSTPGAVADIPDWLNSITPTQDATLTFQSPEWLRAIPPASKAPMSGSEPNPEPPSSSLVSGADELPDWMRDAAGPADAASPFETVPPAPEAAALPSLTETSPQPSDDQATIPDWLKQAGWGPSSPEAVKESEQRAHDEWHVEDEPEATVALPAEDIPDWLRAMAPPELRSPDQASAETAPAALQMPAVPAADGEQPEWLRGFDAETPAPIAPEDDSMKPPVWLRTPLEESEPPPSTPSDESLPSWLREPLEEQSEQTAAPSPAPPAPADSAGGLPDWLQKVVEEEQGAELSMDAGQGRPFVGQTGPLSSAPLISPALSEKPLEEPEVWVAPEEPKPAPPPPVSEARDTAPALTPAPAIADSPAVAEHVEEEGPAAESAAPAELPEAALHAPEPVTASATEPTQPSVEEMSADDALAWLESLAARQGADSSELFTRPEDRPTETPRWIEDLVGENASVPADAGPSAPEVHPATQVGPSREDAAALPMPELPDWLKAELEAQDFVSAAEAPATVPKSIHAEAEQEPVAQQPAQDEGKPESMPVPEPSVLPETQRDYASGERTGASQDAVFEPEAEPEPDSPPVARWDFTPVLPEAAQPVEPPPAAVDEPHLAVRPVIAPVAETPEDVSERAPEPDAPAEEKERPAPTPKSRRAKAGAPSLPRGELLSSARRNVMAGSFEEGLAAYGRLIKTGSCLSEVIADLENTLAAHPADPTVLQLLGDAYMADNQLQRALDTYRLALDRI